MFDASLYYFHDRLVQCIISRLQALDCNSCNLPAAPDIDGGSIALLAQEQLGRPVPKCDHLVGVRPILVLLVVQTSQAKIGQLYLASKKIINLKKNFQKFFFLT